MSQIRKSLAGEEDIAFDLNRNNETYEISGSSGQLELRHKINDRSIPVTLDAQWKNNTDVHDYILDLVDLLEKVERNEIYGASTLAFGASKVDYLQVNSNLANLSATPTGDVAVWAVGGSVQLNPEDFTVNGLLLTFVDGIFDDLDRIVVTYSINQFSIPPAPSEEDVEERLDVLEAEQVVQNARLDTLDIEQDEQDVEINLRTKWVFPPKNASEEYFANEMTRANGWTMIANKDTFDNPSPTPIGDIVSVYTGDMPDNAQLAKQIVFGNRYTFPQALYLRSYRVKVVAGNEYEIYTVIDPLGSPILEEQNRFIANTSGWITLNVTPSIVASGTMLDLVVRVNEPDPTPTTFNGNWNYSTPNNDSGAPSAGEALHSNNLPNLLKIHYTDSDTTDRKAELLALSVGDVIEALGVRWSIQNNTDNATYATFTVAPTVQSSPDGVTNFTFETTTATPVTYGEDVDYWLGNANVEGLFIADGEYADIVPNDNAYGVDLTIQEALISEDWDVVSPAVTASGGGTTNSILVDGSRAFIDNQSMGNNRLTELADPVNPTDAVNLQSLATVNWCRLSNADSAPVIDEDLGIDSVSRLGAGKYQVTLTSPMTSNPANIDVGLTVNLSTSTGRMVMYDRASSTDTILLINLVSFNGSFADADEFTLKITDLDTI